MTAADYIHAQIDEIEQTLKRRAGVTPPDLSDGMAILKRPDGSAQGAYTMTFARIVCAKYPGWTYEAI